MDYEKKYNEALKWMRELYPGLHGATKEDAEHFFPELRESEDERIRRILIEVVNITPASIAVHNKRDLLAWLEKQKEPKHAPDDFQKSFEAGQRSIVDNPEQYGLCKKTEWSSEDEFRLKEALEVLDESIRHLPIGCGYLTDVMNVTKWLKSLRPQPKQEGLEEEINRLWESFADEMEGPHNLFDIYARLARHFAKWGADHAPLPEDTVLFNKGVEEGKRLMMEEAYDGEFFYNPYPGIALDDCKDYDFKQREDVRVIILPKED
jgi:hypothetical protein